ncbi:hypothetical protein ACFY93_11185 [Streptomyces sp. NPDC008313]|uniref:hypothetical protein n=1 Tax=Streptomyces sp. NPDC008313 TaxID=3364826 RepID=UPI0036E719FC
MTAKDIGSHDVTATVRVHTQGAEDAEALAYIREKVGAVLDRPGLPPVGGEVRVVRAADHHDGLPWSAGAEIRVGRHAVVVHAREADAHALAERLQDRLRSSTERVAHRADAARRTATPPPWRGGPRQ